MLDRLIAHVGENPLVADLLHDDLWMHRLWMCPRRPEQNGEHCHSALELLQLRGKLLGIIHLKRIIANDPARVGPWIQAHGGGFYRAGSQCIGLERDGDLIAGVLYDYWNGASIYMHVAANGAHWLDREFLHVCFDYPFRQLGAKVVIGLVPESNAKARKFDEHLGFKLTASIPEGHPDGSLLIYAMRKNDCRWLRREHVEAQRTASA